MVFGPSQRKIIGALGDGKPRSHRRVVKDTGLGMNNDQLNHVFDEFYKADKARHDFESSGLGLSICKRIVEKHGGRIWAESPGNNRGTTMFFTIPKSK